MENFSKARTHLLVCVHNLWLKFSVVCEYISLQTGGGMRSSRVLGSGSP